MYFLDNYYKITNVSIFVLGIYTCGISVLLWWMYKGITDSECNISTSKGTVGSTKKLTFRIPKYAVPW